MVHPIFFIRNIVTILFDVNSKHQYICCLPSYCVQNSITPRAYMYANRENTFKKKSEQMLSNHGKARKS